MKANRLTSYCWVLGSLMLLHPICGWAHKPSDSYLSLNVGAQETRGQWDIALRDLEYALGLDADGDGAITWGELRARHDVIAAYALSRLDARTDQGSCLIQPTQQLVDHHSDGGYAVLRFTLECPDTDTSGALRLQYRLFFDFDPSHRGLLRIEYPHATRAAILSPDRARIDLDPDEHGAWRQFAQYWREGVWHIWIGFDHVLFLLALLLPAVLWREGGHGRMADSLRPVITKVVGIVTAFTVAHSITLGLAALGWISLPGRWVESAIAATIVLAALNNLYPLVLGRTWLIAFCLGLIHGFGFASILVDLGLHPSTLVVALVGFNLGVETGQLAIVAVFVPLAFALRDSCFYRQAALKLGSLAVIALGTVWFLERSLDLRLVFPSGD